MTAERVACRHFHIGRALARTVTSPRRGHRYNRLFGGHSTRGAGHEAHLAGETQGCGKIDP